MRDILIAAYLEYRNDYLTVAKYAEHNGLTYEQGSKLIDLGRELFYSNHPEE